MHHPRPGIDRNNADIDLLVGMDDHGVPKERLVDADPIAREQTEEHAVGVDGMDPRRLVGEPDVREPAALERWQRLSERRPAQ